MAQCPHCREEIHPETHSSCSDEPIVATVCPNCETILGTQNSGTHAGTYGSKPVSLIVDDYNSAQSTASDTEQRLDIFTRHVERIVNSHDFSDLREEEIQVKVITPMIELLGWNRMTPEVELEAWTGQGEGAGDPDYALCVGDEQKILIEAKQTGIPLQKGENQLHGYLTVSTANWGILSNGKQYRVYKFNEQNGSIETIVDTNYQKLPTYADQFTKIRRASFER